MDAEVFQASAQSESRAQNWEAARRMRASERLVIG